MPMEFGKQKRSKDQGSDGLRLVGGENIPGVDRQAPSCYICIVMQMKKQTSTGCCSTTSLTGLLRPELFKALADPSRLALLLRLAALRRPAKVGELTGCCARDVSTVSRHLSRLKAVGILGAERHGKEVHYRLKPGLADTMRAIADALDACCPPETKECESHGK